VGSSFEDAVAQMCGPGGRFELTEADVRGVRLPVFAGAFNSVRTLIDTLRTQPPDDVFLVYEDERWTFAHLVAQIDALGAALVDDYDVVPGTRVAIAMRNYPEWVVAYAAIVSIGAVAVCLNAWWTTDELDYGLRDSGTSVVLADAERIERMLPLLTPVVTGDEALPVRVLAVRTPVEAIPSGTPIDRWDDVVAPAVAAARPMPDVDIDPDDDLMILYTSGTTGHPKGAVSTHRGVVTALFAYACRSVVQAIVSAPEPGEEAKPPSPYPTAFILTVPLFHVTGLIPVMLGSVLGGNKLVIMYKWNPERALELIERERVTTFVGVPTMSWDLLESPSFASTDTSSLVSVGGGGAPAPPELVKRIDSSFSRGRPSIGYGMTETNAYGPQNLADDYVRKPTSAGRTVPVMQVAVLDLEGNVLPAGEQGEICFRGANLFKGYWNNPDATRDTFTDDGWLRTGDLGRLDEEGFVYVEDRAKDIVIRAGENIATSEVEAAIYEHPSVYEAAVFGIPHERLGEEVVAAVVVRAGHTIDVADLQDHVRARLASFKVPTRVVFFDEQLPRGASGKILKRQLRDELPAV